MVGTDTSFSVLGDFFLLLLILPKSCKISHLLTKSLNFG